MKILRLDLRAFGPFSGLSLDLAAGNQGFHLIYGPNEAGKTSGLRALRNLLYGIPANSQDNFVHDYRNLRIGAVLARRDGQQLEIVRRKGLKGTLLPADEKEPLDEAVLRGFLGGCDQAQFETMFGIDHAGLIAGGLEIVRGQGEIGHVLFAAGAGISDLRTIRNNLEKQAEELFKPGGSKPAVNQSLSELNKARKLVRDSLLPSSEWQKHKTALDEATARLSAVEEELATLSRERSRLQRLAGALPAIARWRQCNEQLAALGHVPSLPEKFAETRLDTISRLEAARQAEKEAEAEIARLEGQIAEIKIPAGLISRAAEIEDIYKALSVYRKAQNDLPGLIAQCDHFQKEAAALLGEMRPDLTLADAGPLKLSKRQQVEIQNLGNQQGALEKQLAQARSAIVEAQDRAAEIAAELAQLPPPRDPAPLADAVRAARAQGNLPQQAAGLREEIASLAEQAAIDLKCLGLWSGPPEAIETLPLPSAETIARFDRTLVEAQATVVRFQDQLEKARLDAKELVRQLEQLRLEGDIPSETDLANAREKRGALWWLVRNDWIERKRVSAAADRREGDESELSGPKKPSEIADAFEEAVRGADEIADRLRREANRVASQATLQARLGSLVEQSADYVQQHAKATNELRQIEESWHDAWGQLGFVPLPPREMQAWTQRQQAIVQKVQTIRQRTAALARLDEEIAAHCRQVQACLENLGGGAASASLDALLVRADSAIDAIKAADDARRQLEKDNARIAKVLAQAESKARQAEFDLAQWRTQWAAAIAPLGLAADTSPAVASGVVAQSVELFVKLSEAAGYAERIEGIGQDAQGFRRNAEQLLAVIDTEHQPTGVRLEEALEDLIARLRRALAEQKNLDLLQSQWKKLNEKRQQSHDLAESMEARFGVLCKEARCETAEELPAIEARAAEARRLRRERDACQSQLLELSGGGTLDDLLNEAASIAADSLPGELQRIGETIAELERTRDELNETKGGEKNALAGMDASATAAEAAEEAQEILARLESDVQHYLRLRLASAVLREGIERYRKKNEGPVLGRASELFRRLTLGSFDSLRIGFEDNGEQVLEGVRPDGRTVLPTAMSEGTCDQLYLALRLASLETWLQRNEPLPLIVDDILVSFDNARATATLEVLADLSARTQVVFFAHHEHLVELARCCMPPDVLYEHRLH